MTTGRRRDLDELLAEADALGSAGRFAEAARRYLEVQLRAPERPEGWLGYARAQAELGVPSEALPAVIRATEVAPDCLTAYGLAARLGLHFRCVPQVLRLVEAGAVAHSESPEAFTWLARLQATVGDLTGLRGSLRQLERLTGRPRTALVSELADDPDLGEPARANLRRAARLQLY